VTRGTVLVVDDHQVVREGVRSALEKRGDLKIVGTCGSGDEAIRMARELRPTLVIMDLTMPRLSGVETTHQIKAANPAIKVIVFSMHSFRDFFPDLVRAGISAYVEKGQPIGELYRAVDIVLAGGTYFSEDVSHMLAQHLVRGSGEPGEADLFELLSPREREVFQLVAEGHSQKRISHLLAISPKTVATHKAHIMEKLQLQSLSDWVKEAIRRKVIAP
jgi:DNA-binding NarL/FixJ family response regulator